ncbi:MAG: CheR family methyltransferase [Candidatus Brocadiia bacterium]
MGKGEGARDLEMLLEYLRDNRGFDFTGYKRPSLDRRIRKRMADARIKTLRQYRDYLDAHPEEFALLFNTILINVTAFFRDPPAWDFLCAEIIPKILASAKPAQGIRAWSPGCASGEEPYTLAMVLAEALGEAEFHHRVKIYATDMDQEALRAARRATFAAKAVAAVPPKLLEKYFEQAGDSYALRSDMRNSVIFGRHDVCHDAPISHLDLILCRNTLMYFNTEAQARALAQFHFGLKDAGYLFLGRAEAVLAQIELFTPVSLKHRIFAKAVKGGVREVAEIAAAAPEPFLPPRGRDPLLEWVINTGGEALIAVDRDGRMALANEPARKMFGLNPQDVGRPFHQLQLSYRPVDLRTLMDKAYADRKPISVSDVQRVGADGVEQVLDVRVCPLHSETGQALGVSIVFQDVTRQHQLRVELQGDKQERETAYEEIQSANEELETTNEELQSTVEELQTTNEELQSANQEMETVNEELQSTNEEVQKMNELARRRSEEVARASAFLQSILASVRVGVVVVDADFKVALWNDRAGDLWGLRSNEVIGKSLFDLDIGLPVKEAQRRIRGFLTDQEGAGDVVMTATNRRGKTIQCRVTYSLRLDPEGKRQGVVLMMEEV